MIDSEEFVEIEVYCVKSNGSYGTRYFPKIKPLPIIQAKALILLNS
jgi:hypothetical protein